jgi:hypothetical protein
MPTELTGRSPAEQEARHACALRQRPFAFVQLITTAALALSTAVAVTAVSIGMARADVIGAVAKGDGAPLAIALLVGLLLSAMGGLTALVAGDPQGS